METRGLDKAKVGKVAAFATVACLALGVNAMPSVTINSVVQRWPWNNKVDIAYTVSGGQTRSAGVYCGLRFSLTVNGQTYAFEGSSIGASAENGSHVATWTAPQGIVAKDASLSATLFTTNVPSGNDYMIVDLGTGDVCYEGLMNTQAASNERYNMDTYKTSKMALRRVPKWSEASSLPNYGTKLSSLSGYPTGDNVNNPYQNKATNWVTSCSYYVGVFPVTQSQYRNICGSLPSGVKNTVIAGNEVSHRPVENVTWLQLRSPYNDNATDFAPTSAIPSVATFEGTFFQRLNYRTGLYFDLPTEIMYEIALRAGATTTYFWGDTASEEYIWCKGNAGSGTEMGGSAGSTVAVGLKAPNDWGFYDIAGNVMQWCLDDANVSGAVGYVTSRPDAFTPYCGVFPRSVDGVDADKPKRRTRGNGYWASGSASNAFWASGRGSQNANDKYSNNKGFRVAFVAE